MEEKIVLARDDELDLRALARVIWDGRWFIGTITGGITLMGLLYALLATPFYKSTITLYPASSERGPGLAQFQGLAASFGINVGGGETDYNIPDVVKSRRIRKTILNQRWETEKFDRAIDLITYWEINDTTGFSLNPLAWVTTLFAASRGEGRRSLREWEEGALERLDELISVSEDRKTGLIRIGVLIEEPQLAADIANYIASAVTDYIQAENLYEASRDRRFIQERLAVVKEELERAETDLKEFRKENRRITDSPELQLGEGRFIRQVEMKQQVYITLQQQLELSRIEEVRQTPVIHTLDEAEAPIHKEKPKRRVIVLLTLVLGIGAGTATSLIRNQFAS